VILVVHFDRFPASVVLYTRLNHQESKIALRPRLLARHARATLPCPRASMVRLAFRRRDLVELNHRRAGRCAARPTARALFRPLAITHMLTTSRHTDEHRGARRAEARGKMQRSNATCITSLSVQENSKTFTTPTHPIPHGRFKLLCD
jgi:hypothetical protein